MKNGRIPFQGKLSKADYFEGWYIKVVDTKSKLTFAIIPGISTQKNDAHSFVQLISNHLSEPLYIRYPLDEFIGHPHYFDVRIGCQKFGASGLNVSLNENGQLFEAQLKFSKVLEYPYSSSHPSIMGPYNFLPGIQCHHAVYGMHMVVNGNVRIGDHRYRLRNATAYIEKDFGTTFPKQYVWIQGNTFDSEQRSSFLFSMAKVPHQFGEFTGHIGYIASGNLFERFTSYDHSKVQLLEVSNERVLIEIVKKKLRLKVEAQLSPGYVLKAPTQGGMKTQVNESLTGTLYIELYDNGLPIFSDSSSYCGVEVVGFN